MHNRLSQGMSVSRHGLLLKGRWLIMQDQILLTAAMILTLPVPNGTGGMRRVLPMIVPIRCPLKRNLAPGL